MALHGAVDEICDFVGSPAQTSNLINRLTDPVQAMAGQPSVIRIRQTRQLIQQHTTTFRRSAPKVNTFYGHTIAVNSEMKEDWDAACQVAGLATLLVIVAIAITVARV